MSLSVPLPQHLLAILLGRQSQMLLDIAAKEGKIGKLQFVADFLDTPAALFQQEINVLHHLAVDKFTGRFATDFLADSGQVLGREA